MSDDPRYPVGRFAPPPAWDPAIAERQQLAELPAKLRAAVAGLSESQLDTPYRDGGWSVRQVVHHMADSHMNAFCRFKLALTEEHPTIKPYNETLWAELPDAQLPLAPSLQIIDGTHVRWVALIDALTPEQMARTMVHPEHNRTMTLWWVLGLYAWHSRHHVAHIIALRAQRGW